MGYFWNGNDLFQGKKAEAMEVGCKRGWDGKWRDTGEMREYTLTQEK